MVVANADKVLCRFRTEIWDSTRLKHQYTDFDGSVVIALRGAAPAVSSPRRTGWR